MIWFSICMVLYTNKTMVSMNMMIRLQLGKNLTTNLYVICHLCHCLISLWGNCNSNSSSPCFFSHCALRFSWGNYFALYNTKLLYQTMSICNSGQKWSWKVGLMKDKAFCFQQTCEYSYMCLCLLLFLNRQLRHDTSSSAKELSPWPHSLLLFQLTPAKTFVGNIHRYFVSCRFQGPI